RARGRRSFVSTPTNWTRPSYRRATLASCGASLMQGPHSEPHTLTTTGVPWSWPSNSWNRALSNVGRSHGPCGRRGAETALRTLGTWLHASRLWGGAAGALRHAAASERRVSAAAADRFARFRGDPTRVVVTGPLS